MEAFVLDFIVLSCCGLFRFFTARLQLSRDNHSTVCMSSLHSAGDHEAHFPFFLLEYKRNQIKLFLAAYAMKPVFQESFRI